MDKKFKNIIKLISLSAFSISCVFVVAISINNFNPSKADESPYTINFSSSKNVLNSGDSTGESSTTVTSEKNTSFVFNYSNVVSCSNKWQKVNAGGCFYTKSNDSTYNNKFHDMKTFTFNFDTDGLVFSIYFSNDGVFDGNYEWSRTYATKKGEQVIDAEGHPNYFKFVASTDIEITSLTITYGCSSQADTSWDNAHGVNPLISQDEKTLTYGLYPQTYVATSTDETSELAKALNAKVESLGGINDGEYFWYNDEYYVKDTGNPYESNYTFSDGTKVVKGTTYYFKCEVITWNIISSGDNFIIDCSNILYAHRFDDDSNVYENSELRTWLNGDFYNKAFSIKTTSSYIVPTDLSDVSVTGDKVWVGSKLQYDGDWYSSNVLRQKKVSDFALCNCAYMSTSQDYNRNGYYWTRSSFSDYSYDTWHVDDDGLLYSSDVSHSDVGCSPALTITI